MPISAEISVKRERLFGLGGAVDISVLAPALNRALSEWIVERRWFGSKARTIRDVALTDWIGLTPEACLLFVRIVFTEGEAETYAVPVGVARMARGGSPTGATIIARLNITPDNESALLYDAMDDVAVARRWLEIVAGRQEIAGRHGRLVGVRQTRFDSLRGSAAVPVEPRILQAEQSNSSILFGDRLILKLFRRCEAGVHPDVEVTSYLTGPLAFSHVPPVAGTIEYHRSGDAPVSLAVMQKFVANQGDAWRHTLVRLDDFLKQAVVLPIGERPDGPLFDAAALIRDPASVPGWEVPSEAMTALRPSLADAALLGRRTAELHLALATPTKDPAFQPEPFTAADQQAFYNTATQLIDETFVQLAERLGELSPPVRQSAERLLKLQRAIQARFVGWIDRPMSGLRTRTHGDYHLGQVLWTGDDFMIIDFEGEPARPLAERRLKQSPLRDVAGMLRSLDYAARTAAQSSIGDSEARAHWARVWHAQSSGHFLVSYTFHTISAPFLPDNPQRKAWLLDQFLLEKAVYELRYELNNRPDWLPIPLEAVLALAAISPAL